MNITKIINIVLGVEVFLVPLFFLPWSGAAGGYGSPLYFNKAVLLIVLTLASLFLFLAQAIQDGKLKIQRTPLDYFVAGMVFFYTLAFAFSPDKHASLFHWLTILFLAIFYFLVITLVEQREKLLSYFVWSLTAVAVLFLVSVFVGFLRDKMGGLVNTLGSQSNLVALMAVGAALIQTILLKADKTDKADKADKPEKGKTGRTVFYLFCLAPLLAVIVLVNFRLGWILLALGSLLLVSLVLARSAAFGFKRAWIVLPLLIALASLFSLFLGTPLVYDAKLPMEASLAPSVSLKVALTSSVKNFFGTGPGNFSVAFAKYKPEALSQSFIWQVRFNQATSQFAEALATTGWLGFLSFLALIVLSLVVVFLRARLLPVFLCLLVAGWYLSFNPVWWMLFFVVLSVEAPRREGTPLEFSLKKSSNGMFLVSLSFVASLVFVIFFLSFIGRIYLADYHFQRGKVIQALQYNNKEPGYYLGQAALSFSQALEAGSKGSKNEAITLAGQALNYSKAAFDMAPNNVAVCEQRAALLEQVRGIIAGSNEWTIKTYQKCLTLEPSNPIFHQQLGVAMDIQGDAETALAELQKAVSLRPQLATGQYELGRLYYNKGEWDKAASSFEQAVANSPDYSNALYSLGLVYQKQGKTSAAIQLFKRVLELNPGSPEVQAKLNELQGGGQPQPPAEVKPTP